MLDGCVIYVALFLDYSDSPNLIPVIKVSTNLKKLDLFLSQISIKNKMKKKLLFKSASSSDFCNFKLPALWSCDVF